MVSEGTLLITTHAINSGYLRLNSGRNIEGYTLDIKACGKRRKGRVGEVYAPVDV